MPNQNSEQIAGNKIKTMLKASGWIAQPKERLTSIPGPLLKHFLKWIPIVSGGEKISEGVFLHIGIQVRHYQRCYFK